MLSRRRSEARAGTLQLLWDPAHLVVVRGSCHPGQRPGAAWGWRFGQVSETTGVSGLCPDAVQRPGARTRSARTYTKRCRSSLRCRTASSQTRGRAASCRP